MQCKFDNHLLVLDMPRTDLCDGSTWHTTLDAFLAAQKQTGANASVISSMPEGLDDALAQKLLSQGVAPLCGLQDGITAISLAAFIGERQAASAKLTSLPRLAARVNDQGGSSATMITTLDEVQSKQILARYDVPLPYGQCMSLEEIEAKAGGLLFPVVLKAVGSSLAHKTEAGAVRLNLCTPDELIDAAWHMRELSDQFLVETMVQSTVAELIVGVMHDPQFGMTLTLGFGGIWVELLKDSQTVLLPATRSELKSALMRLRMAPLLTGYRGKPAGDLGATLSAIECIARLASEHADHLVELDVNPLIVLPKGQGCMAVDALIRCQEAL